MGSGLDLDEWSQCGAGVEIPHLTMQRRAGGSLVSAQVFCGERGFTWSYSRVGAFLRPNPAPWGWLGRWLNVAPTWPLWGGWGERGM